MSNATDIKLFENRKVRTVWNDETETNCHGLKMLPTQRQNATETD